MPARSAIYENSDTNIAARSAIYLKYNAEFFLVTGIIPLIPSKKNCIPQFLIIAEGPLLLTSV